jgi:RNA polymerase sigma-70 factor (ECF subfamily)
MATEGELTGLLASVARGDRAALRAIYTRQSSRLFGIALAMLHDRTVAADVLQETFLKLWERARHFDPRHGSAENWLTSILRHTALDAARARGREVEAADSAPGEATLNPDALDALGSSEAGARLRDALMRLSPVEREGIVLAFAHGLSLPEIAARTDLPPATVKTRIRRGLAGLLASHP